VVSFLAMKRGRKDSSKREVLFVICLLVHSTTVGIRRRLWD
jgi:hypothetical protein